MYYILVLIHIWLGLPILTDSMFFGGGGNCCPCGAAAPSPCAAAVPRCGGFAVRAPCGGGFGYGAAGPVGAGYVSGATNVVGGGSYATGVGVGSGQIIGPAPGSYAGPGIIPGGVVQGGASYATGGGFIGSGPSQFVPIGGGGGASYIGRTGSIGSVSDTSSVGAKLRPQQKVDASQQALETFESDTTSKSHSTSSGSGYRRAQGTKIEKHRCTSDQLREIIEDKITDSPAESKLKIALAAKKEYGYNFDVICSESDFSYLMSANLYCQAKARGIVCLAFQH
ncbi:hypothetical protein WR25_13064 [Diploscapter pachys]|uniref:Ground-like domain-containing protein n=1 Tax=Diploscapter pachys TaxID=2018661 RepID=A0A2A2J2H5_9BILA|nr:hypothetical protein WR25_13064 [Diploscapter pachys]